MHPTRPLLLLALLASWGCSSTTPQTPATTPPADTAFRTVPPPTPLASTPNFLHPVSGAPAISTPVVRFWAKVGVETIAYMYYRPRAGQTDSTAFVRFRVRNRSLTTRPDGTPLAAGDSLQITMTLVDTTNLIVDFQPSGLRFATGRPADLKISYLESSLTVGGAPIVGTNEQATTSPFRMGLQEMPGTPWETLLSNVVIGTHEVEADVAGFTRYAIVY